jgi:nitrite reductase/ring-hydroxylating ferredoxin subunit/uncharacterized membrane protein
MKPNFPVEVVRQQEWLEPIAERLQPAVATVLDRSIGSEGAKILHGTWLGHPLHVILTDIPIGSWAAGTVFDLLDIVNGNRAMRRAADSAITVGLCAATATAITGLADWSKIGGGESRRIGLAHGLLNAAATACYLTSLCLRRNHSRRAGRQFAFLGLIVSTVSAYLGGHLVYKKKLGVDHTADYSPPENFIPILADAALPENELKRVNVNGMPVLLVRKGERIYAIAETCAHLGGPLSEGTLEGTSVRCPWHGSLYSLEDGRVLEAPSVHAQPVLEVRIRDGQIEVRKSTD